MPRSLRRAAVLSLLAVLASLLLTPKPGFAVDVVVPSTPQTVRVLSYNVCGAYTCQYTGAAATWTQTLDQTIQRWDADVLMLQETCRGQFDRLTAVLGPRGYKGVFHASADAGNATVANGCPKWGGALEFGLATFVRTSSTQALSFDLAVPENFTTAPSVLCTRSPVDGQMTLVCNAHLAQGVYNGTVMDNGMSQIMPQLGVWAAGLPVLFGGDFNARPTYAAIKVLRNDLGLGPWAEVDEADNQPTTGAKIDYVFAPTRHFDSLQGTVEDPGLSDHRLLVGVLNPKPRTPGTQAGDLTGDGVGDLLAVQDSGQLRLYGGVGGGRLSTPYRLLASGAEWKNARAVHRGDWTGDGWEDVVAAVDDGLWIYPNTGTGELGARIPMGNITETWSSATKIAAPGDMTGDGAPDLLVQSASSGNWWLWSGIPDAATGKPTPALRRGPQSFGGSALAHADMLPAGDLNGDGLADTWNRNPSTGAISRSSP
ncbi:FG-GAP-like repeat-containing protein [Actinoplanes sp. NPDC023714]|uniref:FG-GAP-like repeat-containing protein n=1 Tax=Actinoplanes sp. NPDC023714 TaxID=3154322 RepID=UPI0033D8F5AB